MLCSINETVTEHFGFAPVQFVDALLDGVNGALYATLQSLERRLAMEMPERELTSGMSKLESLFETCIDAAFDRFEVYALKNVLACAPGAILPHHLEPALPHHQACTEAQIDADIDELRKKALAVCRYYL